MSIVVVELEEPELASAVPSSVVLDPLEPLELPELLPLLSDASLAGDPPGPANDVT